MKKFTQNLRKKKGFTLVEVIIVLVILAILAAILIPSLSGYIDKANQKAAIANCRSFVLAAQTIGSETYGEKGALATGTNGTVVAKDFTDATFALAELDSKAYKADIVMTAKGKVTSVDFYDGQYKVEFKDSKYTVTNDTTAAANQNSTLVIR